MKLIFLRGGLSKFVIVSIIDFISRALFSVWIFESMTDLKIKIETEYFAEVLEQNHFYEPIHTKISVL